MVGVTQLKPPVASMKDIKLLLSSALLAALLSAPSFAAKPDILPGQAKKISRAAPGPPLDWDCPWQRWQEDSSGGEIGAVMRSSDSLERHR